MFVIAHGDHHHQPLSAAALGGSASHHGLAGAAYHPMKSALRQPRMIDVQDQEYLAVAQRVSACNNHSNTSSLARDMRYSKFLHQSPKIDLLP